MRCTCRKKENNSRRNGKNAPPRRESPPSRASSRERARSRTRSRRRGAWGGKQRAEREGKFMEPVRGFAEEKKDDDERSRGRRKKEENVTSQGEGFLSLRIAASTCFLPSPNSRTWLPCPFPAAESTRRAGASPSGAGKAKALDYSPLSPSPPISSTMMSPRSPRPARTPPPSGPVASPQESAWSIPPRCGWRRCWCGERGRGANGRRDLSSTSLMPRSRTHPQQRGRRRRRRPP